MRHNSNSKAQNSTIGFSSSTNNTTGYSKSFGDSAFRSSKYLGGADQTTLTRSSFYKDRDLSETLMMRSQTYTKIECPHCCRKFCRKAGERHIPLCNKIFNKPKPLFRNKEKSILPKLNELSSQNIAQQDEKSQDISRKSKLFPEEQFHVKHKSLKQSHNHSSASSRSLLDKIQNPEDANSKDRDRSNTINARSGYARNSFVNNREAFVHQAKTLAQKLCSCCGKKFKTRDRFCVNCGNKR